MIILSRAEEYDDGFGSTKWAHFVCHHGTSTIDGLLHLQWVIIRNQSCVKLFTTAVNSGRRTDEHLKTLSVTELTFLNIDSFTVRAIQTGFVGFYTVLEIVKNCPLFDGKKLISTCSWNLCFIWFRHALVFIIKAKYFTQLMWRAPRSWVRVGTRPRCVPCL